ncbi:MAG TPA: substrate-binding domain-containing protein [Clostridia bacterium]|nr:substrate-binding domain-containing protein [Clostridia bacterium]
MKSILTCLKTAGIYLLCALCLVSCAKPSAADDIAPAASPTPKPEVKANAPINVSGTLIGFVVPEAVDEALYLAMHGFLRTAENLGYPAKLFRAAQGIASVAMVEQAAREGCAGLLVWDENGTNAAAIKRANELSIPVVVPYYKSSEEGVLANPQADLLGYTEEVALSLAQRMQERECKAGKILVYGTSPEAAYGGFVEAVAAYYPQFNVAYFKCSNVDEQAAVDELAEHILWNRDIKGLFCTDRNGARIAVRARQAAQNLFKRNGAPEAKATPKIVEAAAETPLPSATPVPEGLIKSIVITVAGYGFNEDTISLLRKNDINALVLEPYYDASAHAVMLLDRILNGQSVSASSTLNMPIVRLATLEKYELIYNQAKEWFGLN